MLEQPPSRPGLKTSKPPPAQEQRQEGQRRLLPRDGGADGRPASGGPKIASPLDLSMPSAHSSSSELLGDPGSAFGRLMRDRSRERTPRRIIADSLDRRPHELGRRAAAAAHDRSILERDVDNEMRGRAGFLPAGGRAAVGGFLPAPGRLTPAGKSTAGNKSSSPRRELAPSPSQRGQFDDLSSVASRQRVYHNQARLQSLRDSIQHPPLPQNLENMDKAALVSLTKKLHTTHAGLLEKIRGAGGETLGENPVSPSSAGGALPLPTDELEARHATASQLASQLRETELQRAEQQSAHEAAHKKAVESYNSEIDSLKTLLKASEDRAAASATEMNILRRQINAFDAPEVGERAALSRERNREERDRAKAVLDLTRRIEELQEELRFLREGSVAAVKRAGGLEKLLDDSVAELVQGKKVGEGCGQTYGSFVLAAQISLLFSKNDSSPALF